MRCRILPLLGVACLAGVGMVALYPPLRAPIVTLTGFAVACLAGWLAALRVESQRRDWILVLSVAVLLRIVALPIAASDDMHRYLWEGKIQSHGFNPYRHPPNDPALDPIADEHRTKVNHPEMTAIYGPLTLAVQAGVAKLWYSPLAFKILFLLLDLAVLGLLSRNISACTFYGWCPLPVLFLAGFGHNEILWVLPFVAGLRLLRRPAWAAAMFGLAIAFKPTAAVAVLFVLPFLAPRVWAIAALVPMLSLLPYAGAGWGTGRSLVRFATAFEYNDFWPYLATPILSPLGARLSAIAILAVVWFHAKRRDAWESFLVGMTAWLLLSPTVHPWYALGLAAAASRRPSSVAGWLLFGMGFYYVNHVEIIRIGTWTEYPWVRALVYGPLCTALAARWIRSRAGAVQLKMPSDANPEAYTPSSPATGRQSAIE